MPHDFQCEAIAKFLIPDQPQEDNYPDHNEFKEKEKEWEEKQDLVLAQCTAWVEKEQIAEAKCAAEATCAATEKQKLRCEAAEHKQKTATHKKVGSIVDILASGSLICVRCSLKGPSNLLLICNWLMMVLRDRLCEEGWWSPWQRLQGLSCGQGE